MTATFSLKIKHMYYEKLNKTLPFIIADFMFRVVAIVAPLVLSKLFLLFLHQQKRTSTICPLKLVLLKLFMSQYYSKHHIKPDCHTLALIYANINILAFKVDRILFVDEVYEGIVCKMHHGLLTIFLVLDPFS